MFKFAQPQIPQNIPNKSHKVRNVSIVAVIIIVAIIAIAAAGAANRPQVTITGTNLQIDYIGITSNYFGPSVQSLLNSPPTITVNGGGTFTYTLTLTSSAILFTHTIDSITVETPGFTLVSVSPSTPISVPPGGSVTITLTISVPNQNYNGPLTILVSTH